MKKSLKCLIIALSIVLLFSHTLVLADEIGRVVCLGANLTEQQRQSMLDLFKVDKDDVVLLEVTNQEEREYLEGLVPDKKIGTRAISSVYVEILPEGEGILVETHKIDWVTPEMYANAMATAGIENAKVIAAAPFNVSGTAALTGITKAFEAATGEELSEEQGKVASEELVVTGELGDDLGKDQAAALVKEIKERILKEGIKKPEDIRKVIIEIAADLDITLTDEHIDKLAQLMEKIGNLDLNAEKIIGQLDKISKNLQKVTETLDKNKGAFQKILDAIKAFFRWLAGLLK